MLRPLFGIRLLLVVVCLATSQRVAAQEAADSEKPPKVTLGASAGANVASDSNDAAKPQEETKPEEEKPEEEKLAWDLLHRRYNTWLGPTGGLFLVDGSTGEPGALRVQLGLDLFSGDDVLFKGDHVEQESQALSLSWTAVKLFEVYASLSNRSTSESLPKPATIASLGDLALGGKVGGKIAPLFYLAGDLRAAFASQIGGGGDTLAATNLGLRSELSAHFEELPDPIPLVLRFNVGYLFDNTSKLVSEIEANRYKSLPANKAKASNETGHLVTRFERLGNNLNRLDRLSLGLGAEVPLEVTERFYLHPLLEWRMDIPVNRQGYDCPFVKNDPKAGSIESAQDSCYERTSGNAFPMNLAFGVRAVPPVRGVSMVLAVDFGLLGANKMVRELSPNLPYRLMLALGYDYDARPAPKPPAPVVVEPPKPPPSGRIQGVVTSSEGGPVAGAIVAFTDHDVSAVATSSDGHFISEAFAPGDVHMEVNAPEFETGSCVALIPGPGGNVEAQCLLTPKPRVATLRGRVVDAWGSPVLGARIALNGPSMLSATSDVRGAFEITNLQPGDYNVKAEADGYFLRLTKTSLEPRAQSSFEITMMQKPVEPSISVSGQTIVAKKLKFVGNATELDDAGAESVAEIADLMLTRTDISVRVQGYGDDAVALSRALLIKQRLVDAGVPESRVEAVGGAKGRMTFTINP